ncbi:MAG: SPFH domain-containing protein [Candidatus Nanohaloarchaea archaeon]
MNRNGIEQIESGSVSGSDFSTAKFVITGFLFLVLAGVGTVAGGAAGGFAGAAVALVFYFSIVINQEYERAVVFRLGSFNRVLGSGINVKIPFLEWIQKVDYRVKAVNVQPQKVLTKDNVTVTVDAIVFYKVKRDSEEIRKAVLEVEDYNDVTVSYGQTMLRAIIGRKELDEILQHRDEIADELRKDLDRTTNDFGIHIRDVEIQDVSIPDSMERAMAAEAEAERSRRAKIKEAQGEVEAAVEMRAASDILGEGGYKLRTLETLDNVAQENSTILTIPAELMPGSSGDEGESPVSDLVQNVVENAETGDLGDLTESLPDQASPGEDEDAS